MRRRRRHILDPQRVAGLEPLHPIRSRPRRGHSPVHAHQPVAHTGRQHQRQQPGQVRLVQRRGKADLRRKMPRRLSTIPRKPSRRLRVRPTSGGGKPPRRGEMVERHHRRQPAGAAALDHRLVVIQHGDREQSGLRLDPRPFQAEPVAVQSHPPHQVQIGRPQGETIGSVSRRLGIGARPHMLERPHIAVDVCSPPPDAPRWPRPTEIRAGIPPQLPRRAPAATSANPQRRKRRQPAECGVSSQNSPVCPGAAAQKRRSGNLMKCITSLYQLPGQRALATPSRRCAAACKAKRYQPSLSCYNFPVLRRFFLLNVPGTWTIYPTMATTATPDPDFAIPEQARPFQKAFQLPDGENEAARLPPAHHLRHLGRPRHPQGRPPPDPPHHSERLAHRAHAHLLRRHQIHAALDAASLEALRRPAARPRSSPPAASNPPPAQPPRPSANAPAIFTCSRSSPPSPPARSPCAWPAASASRRTPTIGRAP